MAIHPRRPNTAVLLLIVPCSLLIFVIWNNVPNNQKDLKDVQLDGQSPNNPEPFSFPLEQRSGSGCPIIPKCDCDSINPIAESEITATLAPQSDVGGQRDGNLVDASDPIESSDQSSLPAKVIYVITPTYARATQLPDMTRLSQTLQLANYKLKNIFWIVSEDALDPSVQVTELLSRSGLPYVHLLGPRPITHRDKRSGRGVSNRLMGLKWLRDNFTNTTNEGVIYFADDDNSYDVQVFEEMASTKKVSVWPVGCLAKVGVSSPVVDNLTGKVVGFHDPFMNRRRFAVDMAGFAVDLQLFLSQPKATMPYKVGYEEDYFIRSLGVKLNDLEPKGDNCTKVNEIIIPFD